MKKTTNPKMSDNTKVLSILKGAPRPVSTAKLASAARIDKTSVPKRIYDLRAQGYNILTVSRKGENGASRTTYEMR